LDTEPSFVLAAHVGTDDGGSFYLVGIAISPFDADRSGGGAGANESSLGKSVEIEPKPVLQAGALTWTRHSISSAFLLNGNGQSRSTNQLISLEIGS
jgi:hypothetical protein